MYRQEGVHSTRTITTAPLKAKLLFFASLNFVCILGNCLTSKLLSSFVYFFNVKFFTDHTGFLHSYAFLIMTDSLLSWLFSISKSTVIGPFCMTIPLFHIRRTPPSSIHCLKYISNIIYVFHIYNL